MDSWLFASDILKFDKQTINADYTNKRANQFYQIKKLAFSIPIPTEKSKAIKTTNKTVDTTIIRKWTREKKPKKENDYVYH